MVENDEDAHKSIPENNSVVRLAKAFCFMRLPEIGTKCKVAKMHRTSNENWGYPPDGGEYCFAQYFEILIDSKLKTDPIDRFLYGIWI